MLLLPLWSVPPEVASSDQWNVRLRAALSSSEALSNESKQKQLV